MDRRQSLSPGHVLIAVIVGVGAGWGVHAWLVHQGTQSAHTAVLTFDGAAAARIDPSLARAAEPAVALGQSILNDDVVFDLTKAADLSSVSRDTRIGEFRSRLVLRQSGNSLTVQFHDADPRQSARTANAVAAVLSASVPSAPPPTAAQKPVAEPAAPPPPPLAPAAPAPDHALSDALGAMESQLAATADKVNRPGFRGRGEESSYVEERQQQLLTAAVKAAEKTLTDLRSEYAADSAGGVQDALTRIQQALFSVWPASRSAGYSANDRGFNSAGVSASRLRRERTQFSVAMEVVASERRAIEQMENEKSPSGTKAAAPTPTTAPSMTESNVGSQAASAAPSQAAPEAPTGSGEQPQERPLRLLRPANSSGAPIPLWPPIAAGLVCGVLYLAAAALRSRQDEEDEEGFADEDGTEAVRLITPSGPVRTAEFFASAPESRPADNPPPVAPLLAEANPPALSGRDRNEPEAAGEGERLSREEEAPLVREGEGDAEDPWVDKMMKTLSETSFGKMLKDSGQRERPEEFPAGAGAAEEKVRPLTPSHQDNSADSEAERDQEMHGSGSVRPRMTG